MARRQESGLMGKATDVATQKASQMAGGYVGEKAGQLAAEAIEKYGPRLRRRFMERWDSMKSHPKKSAAYAAATLLGLGGIAYLASRMANEA